MKEGESLSGAEHNKLSLPFSAFVFLFLSLFLVLLSLDSQARDEAKETVSSFSSGILAGNESAVMELIHPEFKADVGNKEAFNAWLRKWFEWDDDYIFETADLKTKREGELVRVTGNFNRAWLMGMHADDVDIAEESELTEALEEEGATVQRVARVEEITFFLKEDAGRLKIASIEGMSMYDPQAAAVTSRDPRAKKVGQALSALTKIPVIGGIFSPDEKEFEKGKKGVITVAFLVFGFLALWIGVGVAKTQLQLAVLNAHSFPEGVGYHSQYRAFDEHRERVLSGSNEKRHDFYLRNLIDEGKFEEAKTYVDGMIVFSKRKKDRVAEQTYKSYRTRVDQLHAERFKVGAAPVHQASPSEKIHQEKPQLDVHKLLQDEKKYKEGSKEH